MFEMEEYIIYAKNRLNVNNDISLITALEVSKYPHGSFGYSLDGSISNVIAAPLGSNDANFSGVMSPDSPVFETLRYKPGSVQEYLAELKNGRPQLYLHEIMVKEDLRGSGIGTVMMQLNEYLFAKYLKDVGKDSGFVTGDFFPIGQDEKITRSYYEKNGFLITDYDELYKDISVEEVMDRSNRKDLEKIFG